MDLDEQINDWNEIKELGKRIAKESGDYRTKLVNEILLKLAQYEEKYETAFSNKPPNER